MIARESCACTSDAPGVISASTIHPATILRSKPNIRFLLYPPTYQLAPSN